MASSLENKSVDEICDFLEDQGFPESLLTSFRGIYLSLSRAKPG